MCEVKEEVIEVVEEVVEEAAAEPAIETEPLFEECVDFETFSKSDFRAVKVSA